MTNTGIIPNGTRVQVTNMQGLEIAVVLGTNRDPQSGIRYYTVAHDDALGTTMMYPESAVTVAL